MSSSGYTYPDHEDALTATLVQQREPYPGYWAASDLTAMKQLDDQITVHLTGSVRALDSGCGSGRLLPWIADRADAVTALDPDPDRLAEARHLVAAERPDASVEFVLGEVSELGSREFELLVSSHVMQHVPSSTMPRLFADLASVASRDAHLVVSYCRAPSGAGWFSIERLQDGRVAAERVSRELFDATFARPPEAGVLPVRHIDPDVLNKAAADAGWLVTWEWAYHFLDETDGTRPDDELLNASGKPARDRARDMIAVFSRVAA